MLETCCDAEADGLGRRGSQDRQVQTPLAQRQLIGVRDLIRQYRL